MDKEVFIERYSEKIINDNAAVFIGAGLSMGSGFDSWKDLLSDMASSLRIKIEKEHDLVRIAQYCHNELGRSELTQTVCQKIDILASPSENHEILAKLPIKTFWTTNYDTLIEDALKDAGRVTDIKFRNEHLWRSRKDQDASVYKMHGDIRTPDDVVIIKNDYEEYHLRYRPFLHTLTGHLIEKTFLFVGMSFTDPNLDHVLGKVRLTVQEDFRKHFCILRKENRSDYGTDDDFEYAEIKQELFIKDLGRRYGIETILVDDYSEITDILNRIKKGIDVLEKSELLQTMLRADSRFDRVEAGNKLGYKEDPRFDKSICYLPAEQNEFGGKKYTYKCPRFGLIGISKDNASTKNSVDIPPDYYISIYPTTIQQYLFYAQTCGLKEVDDALWNQNKSSNHPVTGIDVKEAKDYCSWLTDYATESPAFAPLGDRLTSGWVFRLPTADEWSDANGSLLIETVDGIPIEERGNFMTSRIVGTTPVGCFSESGNPYGVQEMEGNIWEWTTTKHQRDGYLTGKGGSFGDSPAHLKTYDYTYRFRPDSQNPYLGFRILFAPIR